MSATRLFQVRFNNWQAANPFALGGKKQILQQLINYVKALLSGTLSQPVIVFTEYDQVAATGSVAVADGGSGTQTITLNGVGSAVTWATSTNNAANQLVSAVNSATNALVYQHAIAARTLVNATGTYTISSGSGTLTATVGGTAVAVTATGVDATDAALLAAAINLNGTTGPKVNATSALGVVTLTASGFGRATLTISSGAGEIAAVVNGIKTSVTWASTDTATATALALAINANPAVNQIVRATSAAGVVTIISLTAGESGPPVGSTGTGVTTGVAHPQTTITLSSASGTITAVINGVRIPVTYATSDTVTAALLRDAINANTSANRLVFATSAAGVVTVTSLSAVSLVAAGTGASASSSVLINAGLYGGVAGNAITTTATGTGLTANQSTLAGGTTAVTLTAVVPSFAGNAVTLAASGNALTAGATRLTGGTATQATSTFPG